MSLYTLKNKSEAYAPFQNYSGNNSSILNQRTSLGYAPTQNQTQLWNVIGQDAGLNAGNQQSGNIFENAWNGFKGNIEKRAKAAENAIGTTGAVLYETRGDLISPILSRITGQEYVSPGDAAQRNKMDNLLRNNQDKLDEIYRNAGYNSSSDYYAAKDAVEKEIFGKYGFDSDAYWNKHADLWNPAGTNAPEVAKLEAEREAVINGMSQEDADKIRKFDAIQNQLKSQTASGSESVNNLANQYRDYRENNYVGKKINQDRGKFLGDAMTTVSTGADIAAMTMGMPMGVLANTVQGGVEGLADELSQNGFENFDWGRAGQNALIGATSGAATAGLSKGLGKAMAKNKGIYGMDNLVFKPTGMLKRAGNAVLKNSAGRGAVSGALGGAVGGGLGAAMNGQDVLEGALSGAGQGAATGAVSGAIMGTANKIGNKIIDSGLERAQARAQAGQDTTLGDKAFNKIREIQSTGQRWTDSGKNFSERWNNTVDSGKSTAANFANAFGEVGSKIDDKLMKAAAGSKQGFVRLPSFGGDGENTNDIEQRLDYLRKELRGGTISYGELAELQEYAPQILASGDVELAEAAGIPEDEFRAYQSKNAQPTTGTAYQDNLDYETRRLINGSNKDWDEFLQSHGLKNMDAAMTEWHKSDPSNTSNQITDFIEWARNYSNPQVDSFIDAMSDGKHTWNEFVSGYANLSPEAREQILSNASDYGINTELQKTLYALQSNGSSKFMRDPVIDAQEKIDFIHQRDNTPTATQKTASTVQTTPQLDDQVNGGEYEPVGNQPAQNQSDSPNTIKEALKQAFTLKPGGTKKGFVAVPSFGKDKGNDYTDDINNMVINRNDLAPTDNNPETELYRALTGGSESGGSEVPPVQTQQLRQNPVDPWDNLAKEFGYATYNDAIRAFAQANPNTPISAGAVTTWLDNNAGNYNPNARQVAPQNPQGGVSTQQIQEAEIVPKNKYRSSEEISARKNIVREITSQFDSPNEPTIRRTNPDETFYNMYDKYGLSDANDIRQAIQYAEPGGLVPTMISEAAGKVGVVDLSDANKLVMDLNLNDKTISNKTKNVLSAIIDATPSTIEGNKSGADSLQLMRNLEKMASDAKGTNGTYRIGNNVVDQITADNLYRISKNIGENLDKAAVQSGAVQAVVQAHAPEIQQMRSAFPNNQKWQSWVDDITKATTVKELRSSIKDPTRASIYIHSGDERVGSVGNRTARGINGDLSVPTTDATIRNRLVNWGANKLYNSAPARQARIEKNQNIIKTEQAKQMPALTQTPPVDNNATTETPVAQTTSATSNPQTQIYDMFNRNNTMNIIGRNIGEQMGESQRPIENYLQEASAEAGYMPPLAATTSTYGQQSDGSLESLANGGGQAVASSSNYYGPGLGGYYSSTGNGQVDVLGRAMELAMDAGDDAAFGTLYQMYSQAVGGLQDTSNPYESLTVNQQNQLAKIETAEEAIDQMEQLLSDASGAKGGIKGTLQSWAGNIGLDSNAKAYNDMVSGFGNEISKVLGKQNMPQITDDAQTAATKIQTLRDSLARAKANYYRMYGLI